MQTAVTETTKTFPTADDLQVPLTHRASFLTLTSAQSRRRATGRNSSANHPQAYEERQRTRTREHP